MLARGEQMSAQTKTAPTAPFDDRDPQAEPLVPAKEPERDWRDHSFDARRAITSAERSGSLFMKKANLLVAQNELMLALEKLG